MTPRLTLFTATLVQDSALSVSGLDRESSSDQPFTLVDGVPVLVGRGLKGAAVAMAKRFFDPLPRAVSDDIKHGALRRSAWEFTDATTKAIPNLRAGVGIRHKTGARATGVLYDREVIPAETKWQIAVRVDWSHAVSADEGREAEGILGYVLSKHWAEGRCWLGGGAARGLGWCHLKDLRTYRLDANDYDRWVESGRDTLPPPLTDIPTVMPTRSWCFRTLDVRVAFGEHQTDANEPAWGIDMLAVGPADMDRTVQQRGDGDWAKPCWADQDSRLPPTISTDRAILMEGNRPLLPGASVRGPIRHAFSRLEQIAGTTVQDPHLVQGAVPPDDVGGRAFGTVSKSSAILIRDGRAEPGWAAARLHMHAEDEFSAGSYGTAKRDAVRLLKGAFPVRILVEGATPAEVDPLVAIVDRQVALGALGHLPLGGHKTRGAGWGHWHAAGWVNNDVNKMREWDLPGQPDPASRPVADSKRGFIDQPLPGRAWVQKCNGSFAAGPLTLGAAARLAREAFGGKQRFVAWWCDPTIDLNATEPAAAFDRTWPADNCPMEVDEVAFFGEKAVWRAARTASGLRYVFITEVAPDEAGAVSTQVVVTPARLHGFRRFAAANTGTGQVLLREWHVGDEVLGFTITMEQR